MGSWKQGTFNIRNKEKYIGSKEPFYRSSWEERFMNWCDNNPNIVRWSSEEIKIPYIISENGFSKTHNYYPDFYIEVINKEMNLKKYVVEIKPYNQGPIKEENKEVYVPKPPKNKNAKSLKRYYLECKTYMKNTLKWQAAKTYCLRNGFEFIVLTRKDVCNF